MTKRVNLNGVLTFTYTLDEAMNLLPGDALEFTLNVESAKPCPESTRRQSTWQRLWGR